MNPKHHYRHFKRSFKLIVGDWDITGKVIALIGFATFIVVALLI